LLGIDTDPDRPDPDQHALDADPYPDPAKLCGSQPIWTHHQQHCLSAVFIPISRRYFFLNT
jgi:hypothetical protein